MALQNWEVCYQQDTPVAPRFDVNAPDLYIPAMGFITYVLVAGLALGTQNRYHTATLFFCLKKKKKKVQSIQLVSLKKPIFVFLPHQHFLYNFFFFIYVLSLYYGV